MCVCLRLWVLEDALKRATEEEVERRTRHIREAEMGVILQTRMINLQVKSETT